MSKYTTEIRWAVEHYSTPGGTLEDRCLEAAPHIFGNYPIWDEDYRGTLETKILLAYYTREIGFETLGLFKQKLNSKLNQIMPYYNQLYETTVQKYDYLNDTYMTEVIKRGKQGNTNATRSGTSSDTSNASSKNSGGDTNTTTTNDFPQSALVSNRDYASSQVVEETNLNSSNTSSGTTERTYRDTDSSQNEENENVTTSRWGNTGGKSQSQLLQEFRATILNIDSMIIGELQDLFFMLW